MRSAEGIHWKRDGVFCIRSENRLEYTHFIASKVKRFQVWYIIERMSNNIIPSLANLPIELIYSIFNCLDPLDLLISVRNVCTHLDRITDTYYAYQVKFIIIHDEDNFDPFINELRRRISSS